MPPCQAFKTNHQACGKNASRRAGDTHPDHLHLCGTHKNSYMRTVDLDTAHVHHTPGRCFHTARVVVEHPRLRIIVLRWCPQQAEADGILCAEHEAHRQRLIERQQELDDERAIIRGLVDGLVAEDPPIPWARAVRILAAVDGIRPDIRRAAAEQYFNLPRTRELEPGQGGRWRFRVYWNWVAGGNIGPEPNVDAAPPPPPPPVGGLRALAQDTQNVHTAAVSQQTNAATDKLLAVTVPESQQTEKTLAVIWLGNLNVSYSTFLRVANDINRWFGTKDCRVVGDNLYRRLLRGLVAMIGQEPDSERKTEMYRRAWEESCEATGMCCEGHISRLCNVLVGFDDAFQPPVPFGEILQSKMAAIAGLDVSDEEKRRQANAFFDEHQTPAEERVAWLEAF